MGKNNVSCVITASFIEWNAVINVIFAINE